jgi:uncharacterized damage-inducible protein DinB
MDLLDRLLEHDRWSTTTLLDACRSLSDAQLDQSFDIGHQTLRATFVHLIDNIEGWTALMIRRPPEASDRDHSIASLSAWHEQVFDTFAAFARRKQAERQLEETFTDFFGEHPTFGGAILHVILHDAEHRSEIVHILNRLGLPQVPEVDLALWDLQRQQA